MTWQPRPGSKRLRRSARRRRRARKRVWNMSPIWEKYWDTWFHNSPWVRFISAEPAYGKGEAIPIPKFSKLSYVPPDKHASGSLICALRDYAAVAMVSHPSREQAESILSQIDLDEIRRRQEEKIKLAFLGMCEDALASLKHSE